MSEHSLEFGFYPNPIDIDVGAIAIRSLPDRETVVSDLHSDAGIEKDWIYAPAQRSEDFMSGNVREKPFSTRVFGLPRTHKITHRAAENDDQLIFHLWSLSFFTGMRLTGTDAGFLDATPLKPGKLVDFVLLGDGLSESVEVAERFWTTNSTTPRQPSRFAAAVHALFLAQYPTALQFEKFLYLYAALDACYALAAEMQPPSNRIAHAGRAAWLCQRFGMPVPDWADASSQGGAEVASIRNDAAHEALYMGEPLGFALHGTCGNQNLTLELEALICRFLVALIGCASTDYVQSPVNTRQRQGLRLG
jgi:hypothetical protein